MNYNLYYNKRTHVIFWWKNKKNLPKNLGQSTGLQICDTWYWESDDVSTEATIIGSSCLAQW